MGKGENQGHFRRKNMKRWRDMERWSLLKGLGLRTARLVLSADAIVTGVAL